MDLNLMPLVDKLTALGFTEARPIETTDEKDRRIVGLSGKWDGVEYEHTVVLEPEHEEWALRFLEQGIRVPRAAGAPAT